MACHEERHEVTDFGALGLRQPGEARVRRPTEPDSPELVGEPYWLDPPERVEELDKRDPGRIGCPEEIGRRWAGPRRPGGIEERSNVAGIAPERGAQGPHREPRASEDVAEPGPELILGKHRLILS